MSNNPEEESFKLYFHLKKFTQAVFAYNIVMLFYQGVTYTFFICAFMCFRTDPPPTSEDVFVIRLLLAGVALFFCLVPLLMIFQCFFDRFRLKDGRYEVRAFLRKKVSCRKEDAVSFGQGSSGSVGLFAKDGSLLLLIPLRKEWNNKEELLLRVRHVLIHQGLKEIPLEEADRLLPAQRKK